MATLICQVKVARNVHIHRKYTHTQVISKSKNANLIIRTRVATVWRVAIFDSVHAQNFSASFALWYFVRVQCHILFVLVFDFLLSTWPLFWVCRIGAGVDRKIVYVNIIRRLWAKINKNYTRKCFCSLHTLFARESKPLVENFPYFNIRAFVFRHIVFFLVDVFPLTFDFVFFFK